MQEKKVMECIKKLPITKELKVEKIRPFFFLCEIGSGCSLDSS